MATTPTPTTPTTYLPVPGQTAQTTDQTNAAQQASQNSTATGTVALTSNNFVVDPTAHDGTLYLKSTKGTATTSGGTTTTAASITTSLADTSNVGPKGDKGDTGPQGPKGDRGDPGTVDYGLLYNMIKNGIAGQNFKSMRFDRPVPTEVFSGQTINLPVEIFDPIADTTTAVTPVYTLGNPDLGSIDDTGTFTANTVTQDSSLTVTANYTSSDGVAYTCSTNIVVKAFVLTQLVVTGPTDLVSPSVNQYTATATFSDGSTLDVTNNSYTIWSISSADLGTITGSRLSVPGTATAISGTISALFTDNGVTQTGTLDISVAASVPGIFYGSAAYPVAGTSGNIDWNTFVLSLNAMDSNFPVTFDITIGSGEFGWFACPVSLIPNDTYILDGTGGVGGGWGGALWVHDGAYTGSLPLPVSITLWGASFDYYVWRTDHMDLGKTQWQILEN